VSGTGGPEAGDGVPESDTGEIVVCGRWPAPEDGLLRLLLRRWAEWRQGGLVPRRSAVDPAAIVPCLPELWMFRLTDGNRRVVCSLSGEKLNEAWGRSIMGRDPMDLWGPEVGALINRRLCRVALTPAILYGYSGNTPAGLAYGGRVVRRLMLPLCDDTGAPYGVMGVTLLDFDRDRHRPETAPPLIRAWRHPCADLPGSLPPG
jgi:hypothetical protein